MKLFCKKFGKSKWIVLLFFGIFSVAAFRVYQKSGLYIDEGMTLYLANGNYNGAVTTNSDYTFFDFIGEYVWKGDIAGTCKNVADMVGQLAGGGNYSLQGSVNWYDEARSLLQGSYAWMTGEELLKQIAVTDGDGFQYGQVLVNQAMDVHPPLYYLLVHTVFSLFPNSCTKYHLFAVNILFLLSSLGLLYRLVDKYFGGARQALLAAALFGFSQGFMSCAVYFRMYAVFTFMVTAACSVQLRIMEHNFTLGKKDRILLIATTVLGFYTHYYFILYFAGIVLLNIFYFVRDRRFSGCIKYFKTLIAAGFISLLIWPVSLYHILFGYRGTEAVEKLAARGFLQNAGEYSQVVARSFFGGSRVCLWIVLFVLLVLGTVAIWKSGRMEEKKSETERKNTKKWMFVIVPALFYSLFMIQITPVREDRYLMCVFPFWAMVLAWGIKTLSKVNRVKALRNGSFLILSMVLILVNIFTIPNYLYLEQKGKEIAEENRNCIMLLLDDAYGYEQVMDLTRYPQTLVLTYTDTSMLADMPPKEPERGFVIYIHEVLDVDQLLLEACVALSKALGKELDVGQAVEVSSKYQYMRAFVI